MLATLIVAVAGCGKTAEEIEPAPADFGPEQSCAIDGMLLAFHDGPKSQVLGADGTRSFFCDTKEVFEICLDPARRRRIGWVWFQTIDPNGQVRSGGWEVPESLFFVVGSDYMGAMGPMLAPFPTVAEATDFTSAHGGRILRFGDIDAALLEEVRQQGMTHLE